MSYAEKIAPICSFVNIYGVKSDFGCLGIRGMKHTQPPMLTYDDALNLNYYKKTTFTGWMNDMRFLIKREEPVLKEATEDTPEEKGEPIFHAWIWPGPYIFDLTDDSKKTDNTFPFTDDGKKQCVDWINEVISAHSNEYPKNKTDGENL